MPFQVTYTTSSAGVDPDALSIGDYVATLDDSVLADYPEYAGMTPREAFYADVEQPDPSAGWISDSVTTSEDGLTVTQVTLWDSEQDWQNFLIGKSMARSPGVGTGTITASSDSTTITGTGTLFTSELQQYDRIRVANGDSKMILGTVSSIESDTSLTLKENAAASVTDVGFGKWGKPTFVGFIEEMHQAAYPGPTTTVTTATV
jgi:hypothetical protein